MANADSIPVEVWKPIPGWETLYSVSSLGRVRRDVSRRKFTPCVRILKPSPNGTGYLKVFLCRSPGVKSQYLIHRLVLFAFVGPCPPGHEANHKNGNKHDNRPENLEWLTPKQNQQHRFKVLGHKKSPGPEPRFGERHPHAKYTDKIIREVRRLAAVGGLTQEQIGAKFGMNQTVAGRIINRIAWPHVA